jgi:RNA polymerase sigma-70 factor (ECF subfamily)
MDALRRKTINEAMVRLADGDRSAFGVLLDELWPVILSFARRGVGHEQDAEDVAQEVFVRLCSRIADFDRERDGVSWAFAIASYEIMSHRRRHQRRREKLGGAALADQADPRVSQEEAVIRDEIAGALAQAMGELSEDDRLALGLAQVAVPVGAQGAVWRKRRQRALERLRSVWRRIHGEP